MSDDNKEVLMIKAKERTVRTQTIEYDLETLVKKLNKGFIVLNPEYQRKHRWNNITSSRLIESLILNIPIPLIYISLDVSADDENQENIARYSVIDGQQRLTAIMNFFNNSYALEGLQVLEELNGLIYKELPGFLVRRLEERMIRCLRIDSTIDNQVKYDIFERLNSGSVKLEAQELRNAIASGPFNTMIKDLAKYDSFTIMAKLASSKNLDQINSRVKKMEDEELVLRYFAISYNKNYQNYKGKMKEYLTHQMVEFNNLNDNKLNEMKENFINVMDRIHKLFGDNAFAKYIDDKETGTQKIKSNFNVAIFDVVCSLFNQIGEKLTDKSYTSFKEIFKNEDFFTATEGSVTDVKKVKTRIEIAIEEMSRVN